MLIGELSKMSGFSRDTIRYYEKFGILDKMIIRNTNNYKDYSKEAIQTLLYVKFGKEYGLTLNEIKQLLLLHKDNTKMCNILMSKATEKIQAIDIEIKRLLQLKNKLKVGITTLNKCI